MGLYSPSNLSLSFGLALFIISIVSGVSIFTASGYDVFLIIASNCAATLVLFAKLASNDLTLTNNCSDASLRLCL